MWNEDFLWTDASTFRSRVNDLNRKQILVTFLPAVHSTQSSKASILETKWIWALSHLNSAICGSNLCRSQFIIGANESLSKLMLAAIRTV